MELRHLFRWNEVGIHISQPEQIPGELPQRGHSVIQSPGLSFVLVKETVCTLFVWQVKMRIPFFHMALVVFQIPLRCIIDITEAPFVRNETINLFSDRCLSHSSSPAFGKGSVSDDIVSWSVDRYTIVESWHLCPSSSEIAGRGTPFLSIADAAL